MKSEFYYETKVVGTRFFKAEADAPNRKIINQMIKNFMDRKFTTRDDWGSEIKTDVSVRRILREKLENFWNQKVDERGNSDGYGRNRTRMEWFIDKRIEEQSEKFANTLTKDTENKIKNTMRENLQKSIGAKLVTELGFDKLLLESKNN